MSIDRRAFLTRSLGGAAVAGASLRGGDAEALTLARPDRPADFDNGVITSAIKVSAEPKRYMIRIGHFEGQPLLAGYF